MKGFVCNHPRIYPILFVTAHVMTRIFNAHACTFPDYLQWQESDEEFNWYTRVRHDRSREVAYSIRHNIIDITHAASSQKSVRWKCSLSYQGKYLLKRRDPDTLHHYSACVTFLRRSQSIVQMLWSKQSGTLDPILCEDRNLQLDPWPLVSFKLLMKDYTPSPFRGGFNMRITDSDSGENGCNYMHRPMKLESDCLRGEGVLFNFITKNCLPEAVAMLVRQRTLPVATWKHKGDHFVILRRLNSEDLFCLRVPATEDSHMNAILFTDLACLTYSEPDLLNIPSPLGVKYSILHLQRYVYRHLCDDEYPQCTAVSCNGYIRHECHKSCKVCDAHKPPDRCSFPRRIRGSWFQTDDNGFSHVNITETGVTIENVGSFRCVTYPDSPSRRSRMHTTVSLFQNGCRPRYTCIKFKRLGPSVLRYTLSRSYVWPDLEKDFGRAICSSSQFKPDPEPINDLYRTQEDTGKPILTFHPDPERVACNLSSSFTLTATFANGTTCHGSLYEHCEDNTRLRLQLHAGCGQAAVNRGDSIISPYMAEPPESSSSSSFSSFSSSSSSSSSYSPPASSETDYSCLAHFEGHHWEKMLMLQNTRDVKDARCLIFTHLDASQALMMLGGQCDRYGWKRVRAGLRVPLMTLQLQPELLPCKYLPITTPPSSSSSSSWTSSGGGGGRDGKHPTAQDSSGRGGRLPSAAGSTFSPEQRSSADYEKPGKGGGGGRGGGGKGGGPGRTAVDQHSSALSPQGNEAEAGAAVWLQARIVLVCPLAMIVGTAGVDWISR